MFSLYLRFGLGLELLVSGCFGQTLADPRRVPGDMVRQSLMRHSSIGTCSLLLHSGW